MASKSFAVLGDPISHSLSPKIHAAAYSYLGLYYSYTAIQVKEGSLRDFLLENGRSFGGFSITMPLKPEAAAIAQPSSDLLSTGVCNTLLATEDGYQGFNTDVAGISFALRDCFSSNPKEVAVLGSGATARSALACLASEGFESAKVYARDLKKTEELKGLNLPINIRVFHLDEYRINQDLTINTLPAGVSDSLPNKAAQPGWLFSANYAQADIVFNSRFAADRTVSGVEMLLGQAIEQVRIFSGSDIDFRTVNIDELTKAMRPAL